MSSDGSSRDNVGQGIGRDNRDMDATKEALQQSLDSQRAHVLGSLGDWGPGRGGVRAGPSAIRQD
jgi:hypothetical protein